MINRNPQLNGGRMAHKKHEWDEPNFEITSKRRKGFPSETRVKRGVRIVHGDKELREKLGRYDPCPCGSGHRFQELLHAQRPLRWLGAGPLFERLNFSGPKDMGYHCN